MFLSMKNVPTPAIRAIKNSDSVSNPVNSYTALSFRLLARKSPSMASISTGTTAASAITSATDTKPVKITKSRPFLKLCLSSRSLMLLNVSRIAFLCEDNLFSELKMNCFYLQR